MPDNIDENELRPKDPRSLTLKELGRENNNTSAKEASDRKAASEQEQRSDLIKRIKLLENNAKTAKSSELKEILSEMGGLIQHATNAGFTDIVNAANSVADDAQVRAEEIARKEAEENSKTLEQEILQRLQGEENSEKVLALMKATQEFFKAKQESQVCVKAINSLNSWYKKAGKSWTADEIQQDPNAFKEQRVEQGVALLLVIEKVNQLAGFLQVQERAFVDFVKVHHPEVADLTSAFKKLEDLCDPAKTPPHLQPPHVKDMVAMKGQMDETKAHLSSALMLKAEAIKNETALDAVAKDAINKNPDLAPLITVTNADLNAGVDKHKATAIANGATQADLDVVKDKLEKAGVERVEAIDEKAKATDERIKDADKEDKAIDKDKGADKKEDVKVDEKGKEAADNIIKEEASKSVIRDIGDLLDINTDNKNPEELYYDLLKLDQNDPMVAPSIASLLKVHPELSDNQAIKDKIKEDLAKTQPGTNPDEQKKPDSPPLNNDAGTKTTGTGPNGISNEEIKNAAYGILDKSVKMEQQKSGTPQVPDPSISNPPPTQPGGGLNK